MQELLNYDKLMNYEASAEGAKRFLAEHEGDEKIMRLIKGIKDELKSRGNERTFESFITYLIGVKQNAQTFLESCREKRNIFKNLSDFDFGLRGLDIPRRDLYGIENISVSEKARTKYGHLDPPFFSPYDNRHAEKEREREKEREVALTELERDSLTITFMQTFYHKYCMVFNGDKEKDKANKLKVRMKLSNDRYISLTRDELDENLTRFRQTHSSYAAVRKYLDKGVAEDFERHCTIYSYMTLTSISDERLTLEATPFRVLWADPNTGKARLDEGGTVLVKTKIFDKFCVDLLREFHDKDPSEDQLRVSMCQKHHLLVDYLLRLYSDQGPRDQVKPPT